MNMQYAKVKRGLLGKNVVNFFIEKLNYHAKTGTMTGTKKLSRYSQMSDLRTQ